MKAPQFQLTGILLSAILAGGCASPSSGPSSGRNETAATELGDAVKRLNSLLARRDIAIVNEFAPNADILFLGSRAEEVFVSPEQLRGFFEPVFARLGSTLSWDWKEMKTSSSGDIGWVFATGDMVVTSATGEARRPYRMTGVLQRRDGAWKWRQFHGSEPKM